MTKEEREAENPYSEEPLLPSLPVNSQFAVLIDAEKQREILKPFWRYVDEVHYFCLEAGPDCRTPPKSAGELVANFSKEERLALYEYTIKNAAKVAKPPELLSSEDVLHTPAQTSKELTPLELKKAMRDFKRRRQAYRTKVSTKNKSQLQVTREIIHNMMVFLGVDDADQGNALDCQTSIDEKAKTESHRDTIKFEKDGDSENRKRNSRSYDDKRLRNPEKRFKRDDDHEYGRDRYKGNCSNDHEYRRDRYEGNCSNDHEYRIDRYEGNYSNDHEYRRDRHEGDCSNSSYQYFKKDKKREKYKGKGYGFNDSRTFSEDDTAFLQRKMSKSNEEMKNISYTCESTNTEDDRIKSPHSRRRKSKKSKHKKKSKSKKSRRQSSSSSEEND